MTHPPDEETEAQYREARQLTHEYRLWRLEREATHSEPLAAFPKMLKAWIEADLPVMWPWATGLDTP